MEVHVHHNTQHIQEGLTLMTKKWNAVTTTERCYSQQHEQAPKFVLFRPQCGLLSTAGKTGRATAATNLPAHDSGTIRGFEALSTAANRPPPSCQAVWYSTAPDTRHVVHCLGGEMSSGHNRLRETFVGTLHRERKQLKTCTWNGSL